MRISWRLVKKNILSFLPHYVKMQYLHFRFHAKLLSFTLEYPCRNYIADDQCSSVIKGSIHHIKYMYIQPFTTPVDWPEIWRLMEVSTMFYICRCCVFTWWGRFIEPIRGRERESESYESLRSNILSNL